MQTVRIPYSTSRPRPAVPGPAAGGVFRTHSPAASRRTPGRVVRRSVEPTDHWRSRAVVRTMASSLCFRAAARSFTRSWPNRPGFRSSPSVMPCAVRSAFRDVSIENPRGSVGTDGTSRHRVCRLRAEPSLRRDNCSRNPTSCRGPRLGTTPFSGPFGQARAPARPGPHPARWPAGIERVQLDPPNEGARKGDGQGGGLGRRASVFRSLVGMGERYGCGPSLNLASGHVPAQPALGEERNGLSAFAAGEGFPCPRSRPPIDPRDRAVEDRRHLGRGEQTVLAQWLACRRRTTATCPGGKRDLRGREFRQGRDRLGRRYVGDPTRLKNQGGEANPQAGLEPQTSTPSLTANAPSKLTPGAVSSADLGPIGLPSRKGEGRQ